MTKYCCAKCRLEAVLEGQAIDMDACWEWPLSKNKVTGYGQFARSPGDIVGAHRAVYEAFVGAIPEGMFVCHCCDNRTCVSPFHLFLGTDLDNKHDMVAKGRHLVPRNLQCGDDHWKRRTPEKIKRSIAPDLAEQILAMPGSCREVGRKFGVHHNQVAAIRKGTYYGSTKGSADKTALLAKAAK